MNEYKLSDATWRRVFRPRGIKTKELAEARPYVPYTQGDGHEVLAAQADLGVPEKARWSDRQLKAAAKDSSGLAMMRHPAPLLGDDFFTDFYSRPIMAELRPDVGVADRPIHHRHPDGKTMRLYRRPKDAWQRENELVWWRDLHGLSDVDRTAVYYAENTRAEREALWDLARREGAVPGSEFAAWLEDNPPPRVVPEEVRARRNESSTKSHLLTSHGEEGAVYCTDHRPGCHKHYDMHKYHFPPGAGNGARLDMHPWAAERLKELQRWPTDWYLVFALEGCLKADATLQYIRDHDEPATVVSVPGITLWHQADGLREFTEEYLQGVLVYVVCDSDWDPTDERRSKTKDPNSVVRQARKLTAQLQGWGAQAVAVGPTPEPRACRLHNAKRHDKRGLDDYLADDGTFEELFHSDACIIRDQNPRRRRTVLLSEEALDGMDKNQRLVHLGAYYRQRAAEAGGTFFIRYGDVANELFNGHWSHDTIRRDTLAMRDRGLLSVVPDTNHRGYTGVYITVTQRGTPEGGRSRW